MTDTDLRPFDTTFVTDLARQLRVDSVRCTSEAASGHASSALSAADLAAVLLSQHLRYDFDAPELPGNDRLVFSKGHASPLYYAMLRAVGVISDEELLTYRQAGSRLEGHPTPRLPWVDVATGSLGQGLPIGVGMAIANNRLNDLQGRTWVLCGDGEMAEGSMWEAFAHAQQEGLDRLTAIVDVNRLGQRGPTRYGWDTSVYQKRLEAFGWHVVVVDGHDLNQINDAFEEVKQVSDRPSAILARTVKGKGVAAIEDQSDAHGTPVPDFDSAVSELGGQTDVQVTVAVPDVPGTRPQRSSAQVELPTFEVGAEAATRDAFGEALKALGAARSDVVVLDAEVSDSTRSRFFAEAYPDRFVQCYLAEQQMIAAAVGMAKLGWTPYAATFAAFLTRAHDFIRMAAVSDADLRLVGSHAGVAIGQDGPSQMGLEDLAMMRATCGSTVLYPCDANQAAALVASMADVSGISYLRANRNKAPVIYEPGEEFPIGGSRVLRESDNDQVTLVGAGITVHEALEAARTLADKHGINARVIDMYSVKPADVDTLRKAGLDTGLIITVEDHWPHGGLGDAVLDAVAPLERPSKVAKLAVRHMPASGTPAEQLRKAGIDAECIVAAARTMLVG
ncbi:transketolase [Natronoglycomyces albus]|uniref:Transketolase n=1 Tax=Natronoglycomyces albus TaxID=2811108 RepID=A0A895XMA1_9ACTN|nr:transketolase [Natronoglycomyces albus]QSB04663.1 transketolase [Natronoglycomyces albus]